MNLTISGFTYIFLLWITALIGVPFVLGPGMLIAMYFGYFVNRNFQDFWAFCWFHLPVALMELLFGMKVVASGSDLKKLNKDEAAIILMNHRTRLDWMFFWNFLLRFGNIRHLKIILKAPLKRVPGLGWAVQHFGFIFLNRRWEDDEKYMTDALTLMSSNQYPVQLLLFPEGTDLSESNRQKNKEYEQKNNLEHLEYLLQPRVKGWTHVVSVLRDSVDAVWDMTIAYPDLIPQTEKTVFTGQFPKEVHFHLKRYNIRDIPHQEEQIQQWLIQRWREKEAFLKSYYTSQEKKEFPDVVESPNIRVQLALSIALWIVKTSFWVGLLYSYPVARWYYFVAVLLYFLFTRYQSIDLLEINYFKTKIASPKKIN